MSDIKIQLPRSGLKALLLFAAKTDIRYYLNAIRVEATGDATRMIATNGHILGLHHSAQENTVPGPTAVTIPRRVVEIMASKAIERKGIPSGVELVRNDTGWLLHDRSIGLRVGFDEVAGAVQYPDYMKVIPKTISGVVGNFNPEYIGIMANVLKKFGVNRYYGGLNIGHNGQGGALVTITSVPEFVGVLMPLRVDCAATYPAFMGKPMSAPVVAKEAVAA